MRLLVLLCCLFMVSCGHGYQPPGEGLDRMVVHVNR